MKTRVGFMEQNKRQGGVWKVVELESRSRGKTRHRIVRAYGFNRDVLKSEHPYLNYMRDVEVS